MWSDALEVGREIIREFPNSRMAAEIREGMATLETKAEAERSGEDDERRPGAANRRLRRTGWMSRDDDGYGVDDFFGGPGSGRLSG